MSSVFMLNEENIIANIYEQEINGFISKILFIPDGTTVVSRPKNMKSETWENWVNWSEREDDTKDWDEDDLIVLDADEDFLNLNEKVCNLVHYVYIPDSVIILESCCFMNFENLIELKMSDKVKMIGEFCFMNCGNLAYIDIPSSVERVGLCCFEGCLNLICVNIDVEVNSEFIVFEKCFNNCYGIKNIFAPATLAQRDLKSLKDDQMDWFGECSEDLVIREIDENTITIFMNFGFQQRKLKINQHSPIGELNCYFKKFQNFYHRGKLLDNSSSFASLGIGDKTSLYSVDNPYLESFWQRVKEIKEINRIDRTKSESRFDKMVLHSENIRKTRSFNIPKKSQNSDPLPCIWE